MHLTEVRYKEKIVVTWDPVTEVGGSVLEKYVLAILVDSTSIETETDISTYATSYTFTGLTPGDLYSVRIKAVNLVGDSEWSEYVECYPGTNPTRAGAITFSSATRNTLALSWTALSGSDTGGTALQPLALVAYHLYVDNGYGGDFSLETSTTATTYTMEYMTPGLFYRFYIVVENELGLTSSASTIQQMMSGTTPTAPGTPTLVSQSSSEIVVEWEEPFDNGGSAITSYDLTWTKVSDSSTITISVVDANTYTFTTTDGLIAGEEYELEIIAKTYITEYFSTTGTTSATGTFYSSNLPK